MAKKLLETRGGRIIAGGTAAVVGVLVFEHGIWPHVLGEQNLAEVLANRVDSVAVGQPFNHDDPKHPEGGLRLEALSRPNASGLGAALYNAYENSGSNDPTKPDASMRAAISCASVILNGGTLTKVEIDEWETARRSAAAKTPDLALADKEYAAVADSCTADLLHGIAAHPTEVLEIPVAKS
jgi:hypothetical protein